MTPPRPPAHSPDKFAKDFARDWRLANVVLSRHVWQFTLPPRAQRTDDTREHFQLLLCLSGSADFASRRENWSLLPGSLALLPPEWRHRRINTGETKFEAIVIQVELMHSGLLPRHPLYALRLPAIVPASNRRRVVRWVPALMKYSLDANGVGAVMQATTAMHALFGEFFENGFPSGRILPAKRVPD